MRITNTLSGQKEEFVPSGDEVKMYVCGITPQSGAHIGHAMSYINFDVIRRYLEFKGYRVRHIQNVTDIEDKIINKAAVLGIKPAELARTNAASFFADMDALNVLRAHVYPYATEEVPSIIEMVAGLIEKGYAYETGGSVYFRVTSLPDYGKLAHRTLDQMLAGARIEVDDDKENPMDFAMWKAAKPGEPSWDSPWGPGRPGWHIECSEMALKYLGETIDIHGGGQDLIFPHHENEIAQSESFTGCKPFVKYWLHNGLLRLGEEKMSKSLGNIVSIGEILSTHPADAMRLFVLSSHYRSPLTYTAEALEAAAKGAERLRQTVDAPGAGESPAAIDAGAYRTRFTEAMDDDFNTPQAMAALFDLAREINRLRDEKQDVSAGQKLLADLAGVLGLTLQKTAKAAGDAAPFIQMLVETRTELRAAKQYQLADAVRRRLEEAGVVLEDSAAGTTWEIKGQGV